MVFKNKAKLLIPVIVLIGFGVFLGGRYSSFFNTAETIGELLTENKELKVSITNLTAEDQIGYAKVLEQWTQQGSVFTKLLFVETDRLDKLRKVIEKEYIVEGDIIYFDALIVKFGNEMVVGAGERALYLWRRVFSDKMAPHEGFLIEDPGKESQRYKDVIELLKENEKKIFWEGIWSLANDPDKLSEYGVRAVYGNAVYTRLRPGLIYVFKINSQGQVYPEVVPDI